MTSELVSRTLNSCSHSERQGLFPPVCWRGVMPMYPHIAMSSSRARYSSWPTELKALQTPLQKLLSYCLVLLNWLAQRKQLSASWPAILVIQMTAAQFYYLCSNNKGARTQVLEKFNAVSLISTQVLYPHHNDPTVLYFQSKTWKSCEICR